MKITKRLAAVALSICISLSALTGLITPANAVNVDAAEFNSTLASFKAEKYEITFFTEWDSENAIGTLNLYRNGETQKIADDVPDSVKETSQGDILFLYDVDFSAECAELGMYTDGKVQKVDSDVQFLLYSNPKKYKASLITSNKGI